MKVPGFTAEASIYKTGIQYHAAWSLGETGGVAVKPVIVQPFLRPILNCGPCYWDLYAGGCIQDCSSKGCTKGDPLCSWESEPCPPSACGCRPVGIKCTTSSDCCSGWCHNGVCQWFWPLPFIGPV